MDDYDERERVRGSEGGNEWDMGDRGEDRKGKRARND